MPEVAFVELPAGQNEEDGEEQEEWRIKDRRVS